MLALVEFIKSNPNWKELLEAPPYCLKIVTKDNRVLFKYSQIESDFSKQIVKESRGIILELNTWKVLCYAFNKFFNYGQGEADIIDWNTASVTSKIDGSTIKFYYYNDKWNIATSGCIDASDAKTINQVDDKEYSFYELVIDVLNKKNITFEKFVSYFDKNNTYVFELTHPVSKIVISYEPNLILIGVRNSSTLQEYDVYKTKIADGFHPPKKYQFSNILDVVSFAKTLSADEEGYVIVDAKYNRVKIKGDAYLSLHRIGGGKSLTTKNIIQCILSNSDDDLLGAFPEYTEKVNTVKNKLNSYLNNILSDVIRVTSITINESDEKIKRKLFAMEASKTIFPVVLFAIYDGKIKKEDFKSFVYSFGAVKIEKLLDKFNETKLK